MPAVSQKQAVMMAIAEHAPVKLYNRNKAVLSMSPQQLRDFASTSRKGLPKRASMSSLMKMKKKSPKPTAAMKSAMDKMDASKEA